MKKVSIIIPVYNVEDYLARCLNSVIKQTYENLEIICIDDGSIDSSFSILCNYAKLDQRIKVIKKEYGGVSSARNAGLKVITGDFVAFVDSDDEIELDCIEKVLNVFTDDVDIVNFGIKHIQNGKIKKIEFPELCGKVPFRNGDFYKQTMAVWAKMFRKNVFKDCSIMFYEGHIFEDLEFCARFFLTRNPVVYYLHEALYRYEHRNQSIMGNTNQKREGYAIQYVTNLDHIFKYLKEKKVLDLYQDTFFEICVESFRKSIAGSPQCEMARCYAEMTFLLRKWSLDYSSNKILEMLSKGEYEITFFSDVAMVELEGVEKILSIKNEGNYKIFRLFGKKIFKVRKK